MPTTLDLPVNSLLPNLAPTKGLEDAKEARHEHSQKKLEEFLQQRFEHFRKCDAESWRDAVEASQMVSLYMEGKQLLRRAIYGNGWVPYGAIQDTAQANIRAINLFRFYSDNILVKWTQSAVDLVARAARDTDQALASARASGTVIDYYEKMCYTALFKQTESKRAMATGNYIRRIYYCEEQKALARKTTTEKKVVGGGGTAFCTDCGYGGAIEEFRNGAEDDQGNPPPTVCPQCQSENVTVEEVPKMEMESIVGREEYETGDIVTESISFYNLRWEITGPLEKSPWLLYSRRIRRDVLYGKFGGQLKFDRAASNVHEFGLRSLDILARTGQAISGRSTTQGLGSEKQAEYVDYHEMWLDPDLYGDIELTEAVPTLSGQEIPAGPLINTFPEGLCVVGVNNFKTILFLYNESHHDHWVSAQYHLKPESGIGDGIIDMVEPQRQFNVGNSQMFTQMRANATPGMLYDESLITSDNAALLSQPQTNVPVSMTRAPENKRISDVVHALFPGQIPGHFVEYVHQHLNNMFQLTAHTTDFSGGLPGVNNSTATGAQIGAANAQSLHSPQLQMLAEMNRKTAVLWLKLAKKHFKDERYFALSGKHGKQDGIWLKAADLDTDILVEVVPESHLPQSGLERRERMKEFIAFFGGVAGFIEAQQVSPTLVSQLVQVYDIDLETDDFSVAAMVGRKRLEQMKAMLPMIEQQMQQMPPDYLMSLKGAGVEPAVLGANFLLIGLAPKPDIRELAHDASVAYYQEWLTTDEGLEASEILREAVKALIDQHVQFSAMGLPVAAGLMPPPIGADGLPLGAPKTDENGMPVPPPVQPGAEEGGGPPPEEGGGGKGNEKKQALPNTPTTQENVQQSANPNLKAPAPGAQGK